MHNLCKTVNFGKILNFLYKRYKEYRLIRIARIFYELPIFVGFNNKNKIKSVDGQKVLIYLVESSHYQYLNLLMVAKALQLRGANVKVVMCGQALPTCELRSSRVERVDPCLRCRLNDKWVVGKFGLDSVSIKNILGLSDSKDVHDSMLKLKDSISSSSAKEIDETVEDSVVRHYYGDLPKSSHSIEKVRRDHLQTALMNYQTIQAIGEDWKPDIVLSNMENYSVWRPIRIYCKEKNIKHVTINGSGNKHNAITLSHWDLFRNNKRFRIWKKSRNSNSLNVSENKKLDHWFNSRIQGKSKDINRLDNGNGQKKSTFIFNDFQNNQTNPYRRVCLYPNVFWEGGMNGTKTYFDSIAQWVVDSIEHLLKVGGIEIFIKLHPGEISNYSAIGIKDIVYAKIGDKIKEINFIESDSRIRAYEISKSMDLNVIYNGTLGLEFALLGCDFIACGRSPYMEAIGDRQIKNKQLYFDVLSGDKKIGNFDLNTARLFAYFYFIKSSIPWEITSKARGNSFIDDKHIYLHKLSPGFNKYFDHICDYILDLDGRIIPEEWS
jgi:hypothetical protein